jgi:hypothetical protein
MGKVPKTSTSDIFVVEVNVITSIHDQILDTICSNIYALKNKRKLHNKEVQLRVKNGAQVLAITVRSIELYLPSGLVLKLIYIYIYIYILFQVFPKKISISCLDMNVFFLL